ncbi:hypothetical protein DAI22_07g110200 [Oryza sativa Japonica Group]|nr:hypothetical protein DAI22_07g110200 [Oryza sativa Japonica Group]
MGGAATGWMCLAAVMEGEAAWGVGSSALGAARRPWGMGTPAAGRGEGLAGGDGGQDVGGAAAGRVGAGDGAAVAGSQARLRGGAARRVGEGWCAVRLGVGHARRRRSTKLRATMGGRARRGRRSCSHCGSRVAAHRAMSTGVDGRLTDHPRLAVRPRTHHVFDRRQQANTQC